MAWIKTAVIASSAYSAYTSNKAGKEAAKGSQKGMEQSLALQKQAREDAINLFSQGRSSAQAGIGSALNFYKDNAQAQSQPLIQGSMMGQQVLGQGGIQANNAILGLPVDMSFANNPQQVQADYTNINNAQLPQLGASFKEQEAARVAALPIEAAKAAGKSKSNILGGVLGGLGAATMMGDGGVLGGIADKTGVGRAIKNAPKKTVKEVKRFIKKVF